MGKTMKDREHPVRPALQKIRRRSVSHGLHSPKRRMLHHKLPVLAVGEIDLRKCTIPAAQGRRRPNVSRGLVNWLSISANLSACCNSRISSGFISGSQTQTSVQRHKVR
jgi:hypothetical protein